MFSSDFIDWLLYSAMKMTVNEARWGREEDGRRGESGKANLANYKLVNFELIKITTALLLSVQFIFARIAEEKDTQQSCIKHYFDFIP